MKEIKINNINEIKENEYINKQKFLNFKCFNSDSILYIFLLLFLIYILIIFFFYYIFKCKIITNIYYKKRIKYLINRNKIYNESNLITFQDKLNWLIIHDTNIIKGKCADKILLHEFSIKKLGKDICNKILKIYNNIDEININELPDKFVLKANHGSGFNIIVENKTNLNIKESKNKLTKWMNIDYGKSHMEFHYSFIKKKIFAEEYIGKNLKNYKFLCYNGEPKFVYLSITEGNNKYRNFYDMNWNFLNFHCLSQPHPFYNFTKPKYFKIMKKYASILSNEFRFVRVDFYELEKEIRLGELTFTPMNTFFNCKNKSHEIELGKYIKII